jgi:hypothetical protein
MALLPVFVCGEIMSSISRHWSADGGAMAEAEEKQETALVLVGAGGGRLSGRKLLQSVAEVAVGENAKDIVGCLLTNIKGNQVQAVKTLIELAVGPRRGDEDEDEIPAEEYRSLAEVLWKELERQGIGDRG